MDHAIPFFIIRFLRKYQSLEVEGLGRFERVIRPARIDPEQLKIHPPVAEGVFSQSMQRREDHFLAYMQFLSGKSEKYIAGQIDRFVQIVHDALESSGKIELPGFGAFYRNADHTIRFEPDQAAFNQEFLGFQPVDIKIPVPALTTPPVVRDQQFVPQSSTSTRATDADPNKQGSTRARKPVAWVIGSSILLMVLFTVVTCWQIRKDNFAEDMQLFNRRPAFDSALTTYSDASEETVQREKASPERRADNAGMQSDSVVRTEHPEDPAGEPGAGQRASDPGDENIEKAVPDSPPATSRSENRAQSKRPPCQIVVGAFRMPENVTRMESRLLQTGFAAYTETVGSLTRVAVVPESCDPGPLLNTLRKVRLEVEKDAWIFQ